MIKKIKELIKHGEGLQIEFKEAKNSVPQSAYETVCSFLNTKGGEILLGVSDNGKIVGVAPNSIRDMKKSFLDSINNPQIIFPTFSLEVETCNIEGRIILRISVPESSQPEQSSSAL